MADEETTTTPPKATATKSAAKVMDAPEPPPITQDQWLPHLESNSAWKFFTEHATVDYGEDTISTDDLDYRQSLRAEHAARIILEIYGFQVKGSIDPLRLVVQEA